MNGEELQRGVELAEQVMHYAFWKQDGLTADEVRGMIKRLFGEEVETALRAKFKARGA